MTTSYKKGLETVREEALKKGYRFYTEGGDGVNNVAKVVINSFSINTSLYDSEDMDMLADVIANYSMKEVREVFCDASVTDIAGQYVKDSYKNSRDNLYTILDTAVKGSMISVSKIESIEKAYVSKDFSVDSAFLYGEHYITPYMIIAILNTVIENQVSKELLCRFINHYMDKQINKVSKKQIEEVSKYLFTQYFVNNNTDILKELDNIREVTA